jgi:chromate transporter
MEILTFFWIFLKASLLSIGGSGNLPFLHSDLIAMGLAKEADFVTSMAVGQVSPGPSGLWSIALGYLIYGWTGAGLALIALSLPPLLVVGVVTFYDRLEKYPHVQHFSRGLALGVTGLALVVTFGLAQSTITDWLGLGIAVISAILALSRKVPIILILILAAGAGIFLYGTPLF